MTRRPSRVGIIGLGFGRAHIPGFQAAGCEVVAVCQRDEANARKIADRYHVPDVYGRWEDMLERARPDIVSITTPPRLHRVIAERAFAAGAHVLCEKPLAMTRAEADAMLEAAARARRIAMTCFNWRFTPAMQAFNQQVRAGALGRVFHVAARWLGGRWADESVASTWRMDRSQAGHGAMGDQGVHLIDMIRWNFGEFARVTMHAGVGYPSRSIPGGGRPADAEDYSTVLGELCSGAQITLTASRVARGANEHTIEAYGTAGALTYRCDRDQPAWWQGELRAATTGPFQRVDAATPSVAPAAVGTDPMDIIGITMIAPLVGRLLAAIESGETPSPSLEDGARAQAVLDAALEAVARRTWVDVPG